MFYGLVNMCLLFIAFLLSVLCFSFYSTFAPRGCGGVEYFRVSPSALLEEVPTTIYPFFEGFFYSYSFTFELIELTKNGTSSVDLERVRDDVSCESLS